MSGPDIPSQSGIKQAVDQKVRAGKRPDVAMAEVALALNRSIVDIKKLVDNNAPPTMKEKGTEPTKNWYIWASSFVINNNKVRYAIANLFIILGILLLSDSLEIGHWKYWAVMEINNLFEFIISIILILNGAILFIKSVIIYFKN